MQQYINPDIPNIVLTGLESALTGVLFDDPANEQDKIKGISSPRKSPSFFEGDFPQSDQRENIIERLPYLICRHWWQQDGVSDGRQGVIVLGGIYTHGSVADGHKDIIRMANGVLSAVAEITAPKGFHLERAVEARFGVNSSQTDFFEGARHPHPHYLFSCLLTFSTAGQYSTDY